MTNLCVKVKVFFTKISYLKFFEQNLVSRFFLLIISYSMKDVPTIFQFFIVVNEIILDFIIPILLDKPQNKEHSQSDPNRTIN